jgi:hypothetical protein
MVHETSTLEFSIVLGECENFSYGIQSDYGDSEDHSDEVSYDEVRDYIKSLVDKVEGFFLGEHRTIGNIYYFDDGTMNINFCDYKQVNWDEYKEIELENVPSIEPKFEFETK